VVVGRARAVLLVVAVSLAFPVHGWAQAARDAWFTFEEAFEPAAGRDRSPAGLAALPRVTGWRDADHYLEEREGRTYAVSVQTGEATVHDDPAAWDAVMPAGMEPSASAARSTDGRTRIYTTAGDLWALDTVDRRFTRLTQTPLTEENPRLSPDGRRVAYTRGNDLYVYDLDHRLERQLTSDGSSTVANGYASWVYYEEILGRASNYAAFWWSPDSRRLAFLRFDDAPVPVFPIYWADGQHGRLELQRYPKAGDPNPLVRVGVVAATGGAIRWMDFEEGADHYLAWPFWTPDSSTLLVQWMNRGQDTLHIFGCNPATGEKRLVLEHRQPSWVHWIEDLTFLASGEMIVRTDIDGWDHLYLHAPDGRLHHRITSGDWRVRSIQHVDEAGGWIYVLAQPGAPGPSWNTQLRRVRLDGSAMQTVTRDGGTHTVRMAPDGRHVLATVSSVTEPPRLLLLRTDGELVREVARARTDASEAIAWGKSDVFTIPSGDGYDLPATWVLPPDFDRRKKYPVVMSVYGGPDAGTVRNAWPQAAAHYWAQRGVIWMAVDHRGSGHFGKAGTALMHRRLGHWEMHDYIAAATWLRAQPFIAGDRIGITGGSYGGYVTALALTRGAGHFNVGQAGSPVTDWRLYDTVYTERYMDTPAENPDGYRDGAVLTWASQYTGGLRLTHGTVDDNVHMQNTLQVVDWFTEHDKAFELMVYPDSRHALQASQRRHAAREAHDYWVRHLLGGQLPKPPATRTRPTD
jgi:dipeptidyl-peptidase-4